jgi:GGDEF domain-containing protein
MSTAENTVWAIMTGGLLSLVLLTAIDTVVTRSAASLRSLMMIAAISGVCVLLSGLPQVLFPGLPQRLGMVLLAGLGLLGSALGLRLLGIWMGGHREDPIVYRVTVSGGLGMALVALVLMVVAALVPPPQFPRVLLLAAALNAIPVLLCLLVAVRAAYLGDPLARWLVLACMILMGMVTGLYLKALGVPGVGLGMWVFTAASAMVFVLIVMVLIIERNRMNRQLARLARLETGRDPATGLPTGAKLLAEVDHVFWRTGRLHGKCVVVGLHVGNLYELSDPMGHAIDNQILAATAARIRRAAGFRCIVGLYHPRCFIVVFSSDRQRPVDAPALRQRFLGMLTQPLQVVGSNGKRHEFLPQVGMSVLTVLPDEAQPQSVIDEAEHQAMAEMRAPARSGDAAPTTW